MAKSRRKPEPAEDKPEEQPAPQKKRAKKTDQVVASVGALEDIPQQHAVDGTVLVWGTGDCGQLGLGEDVAEKGRPTPVTLPDDKRAVQVVCGGMHTACLTSAGEIYSWGVNDEGALGRYTEGEAWKSAGKGKGSPEDAYTPGRVHLPKNIDQIVAISAGDSHTLALTIRGQIWGWGTFRDGSGVMGFAPKKRIAVLPQCVWKPNLAGDQALQISSGADHAAALCRDGKVLTWGNGQQGQLGRLGSRLSDRVLSRKLEVMLQPQSMHLPFHLRHPITAITCGNYSTFVLLRDGSVYGCGLNNYLQLGFRSSGTLQFAPKSTKVLQNKCVVEVAPGEHHTLVRTEDGKVLSWGRTSYGRLGLADVATNSNDTVSDPQELQVDELEGPVTGIAAGGAVSGCTSEQVCGVWVCGFGESGQLAKGVDNDEDEAKLTRVKKTTALNNLKIVQLCFGGQHAAALGVPLS